MYDETWPRPPVWSGDLPDVVELIGEHEANRRFAGWVLVPAGWLSRHLPGGGTGRQPAPRLQGRSQAGRRCHGLAFASDSGTKVRSSVSPYGRPATLCQTPS